MLDYTHYNPGLDPEWLEFAKTFNRPTPPKDLTLAKKKFNESRAAAMREILGPVEGVSSSDVSIPTQDGHHIRGRLYFPDVKESPAQGLPLYIYVHGGGYLFGDLETEDTFCRLYATGISSIVLSVEYRKTPEWRFPTSFHDVFNAVDWILDSAQATEYGIDLNKVIFGGVSSGGTMGLAAAVREVEQGTNRLKGLSISTPATVPRSKFPRHLFKNGYTSWEQNENAPLLSVSQLESLHSHLKADPDSPFFESYLLPDSTLSQLPPIAFYVCGADPLRDSALLLEEKLRKLGVKTRLEVYTGWPHCFWNQPQLKMSARYREKVIEDTKWLLYG